MYIELVALSSQAHFWRWKILSKIKHPGASGIQGDLRDVTRGVQHLYLTRVMLYASSDMNSSALL